jgi:hypothetical protein
LRGRLLESFSQQFGDQLRGVIAERNGDLQLNRFHFRPLGVGLRSFCSRELQDAGYMRKIMQDQTETARRDRLAEINATPGSREALEAEHGQVWDTSQLGNDFRVEGFMAPFVIVRRKSDGQRGSLEFQHDPRFYFNFDAHEA